MNTRAIITSILMLLTNILCAQLEHEAEYTITHIEEDQYFGALSAGTYEVGTGFGYGNKNCIFIFEVVSEGIYKIKAKTSGRYIRASDENNALLSAKNQSDDDYAKFRIKKHDNGSYTVQVVANDWNWKYNSSLSQLQVRKSNYKQDYFIISKYQDPSQLTKPKKLTSKVKLRNLSVKEYLAYDVLKGRVGPLKLGGYFEEYASWNIQSYPNGKVSFVIGNAALLAKRHQDRVLVSKGDGSIGSPDAMWELVKKDNGILIMHATSHTFLSIDAEGGITLTTKMEDPRTVWQLEQKEMRIENLITKNKEVFFATFLNGGDHFGFCAFEHSDLITAQKTLNDEFSAWKYISISPGNFKLQNVGNNKFLSIVPSGDGNQLKLTADLGNQSVWSIKKLPIGGFELKNKTAGLFIHTLDDGNVQLDSKPYGQWFFEPRKDITTEIMKELK